MKDQTKSNTWFIGFIHFILGGWIISFIIAFLILILFSLFFPQLEYVMSMSNFDLTKEAAQIIASILSLWIGVYYSARFIKWRYNITNAKSLVRQTIIIYIIFQIFGFVYGVYSGKALLGSDMFFQLLVPFVVGSVSFYFFSKKFLIGNFSQVSTKNL